MEIESIGKLLGSGPSIFAIELNAEIMVYSSRVVTGSQQYAANAVSSFLVDLPDMGRAGWRRHHSVFGYVHFADSIGTGHSQNYEDGFDVVVTTIASHQQDVFG